MAPTFIDSFFFHPTFWHRHLIHGTNLASPSFFDASLVDTLAGNQLCQWSTVGAAEGRSTHQKDALLLASHLIIHLPPRVGAYVLANHPDLAKSTADTTGSENNSSSQLQVRQNAQFRSPQHLAQPQQVIEAAREQAILGRALPSSSLHSPLLTATLSIAKSPGLFGFPCRPRRKAIRKIIAVRTSHFTPPATAVQRPFAMHFNSPPPQPHQTMSPPMLASFASPTQLTVPTPPHKAQPLRPPLLSFDGSAGELLESHHASSRTPLPVHTARKHYSCFSAANSAFLYAPSSSPNIKRTNRRRSPTPKHHSTEPRRPIASPTTVSSSTCPCPSCLMQPARPKPALAMRVPPLLPSGSALAYPPNAVALPESLPSRTILPSNMITTSRRNRPPRKPKNSFTSPLEQSKPATEHNLWSHRAHAQPMQMQKDPNTVPKLPKRPNF